MNPKLLMKMAMWARNPPSAKRVMLVFGVITACLAIAGAEYLYRAMIAG